MSFLPMQHYSAHKAFSLFEALVCIVILGIIGIICNSMLLQITKNLTYTKDLNATDPYIALLKIENLLQYAIIETISTENNTPLNASTSAINFSSIQEYLLFGGGTKNTTQEIQNNTLLPTLSLHIKSYNDKILYFDSLKGWRSMQKVYLITEPKEPLRFYHITHIQGNELQLDKKPIHAPYLILPIQTHHLNLHDSTLWLDDVAIALNVSSFLITPINFSQGIFLELELCMKISTQIRCQKGGVWLDEIVERLH